MKKKMILSACYLLLSIGIFFADDLPLSKAVKQLCMKITPEFDINTRKPSIAILEFSSGLSNKNFELYIQNLLFEEFIITGKFRVIERDNMDKILGEQKFQISGNVNDDSAKSIGQIIGVDYVCYGTIIDLNDSMKISAKISNIETGEIVSIGNVGILKDNELSKLLGKKEGVSNKVEFDGSVISNWIVTKQRNDFDGYTTYTFILKSAAKHEIIFGYDKWDDTSRSLVKCGIRWDGQASKFEIKDDLGVITSFTPQTAAWSPETGWTNNHKSFNFYYTRNTRQLFDLLLKNNSLSIRAGDKSIKFNTSGFPKTVSDNGITYKELNEAIGNEEF